MKQSRKWFIFLPWSFSSTRFEHHHRQKPFPTMLGSAHVYREWRSDSYSSSSLKNKILMNYLNLPKFWQLLWCNICCRALLRTFTQRWLWLVQAWCIYVSSKWCTPFWAFCHLWLSSDQYLMVTEMVDSRHLVSTL